MNLALISILDGKGYSERLIRYNQIRWFENQKDNMSKTLMIILGLVVGLIFIVWVGVKLKPKPFPVYTEKSSTPETFALPSGLPEPVERFYRTIYGDSLPQIDSFILSGRGRIRFQGVTLPARLRFTHQAGKGYRHYIETAFWGLPILKVNEYFLNWKSRLALPFGVVEGEAKVDQAANLGLWSESVFFPSVYLRTEGVRWEGMDDNTAKLIVPYKEEEDSFTVYFDPATGLIDRMEAMRWRDAEDTKKVRWQAQALEWGKVNGWMMPTLFAAQWMDESSPWLVARIEDVVWNVDVSDYIKADGP